MRRSGEGPIGTSCQIGAGVVAPIGHGNRKRNQKSRVVARAAVSCLNGSDAAMAVAMRRKCNAKRRKYSQLFENDTCGRSEPRPVRPEVFGEARIAGVSPTGRRLQQCSWTLQSAPKPRGKAGNNRLERSGMG